MIKRLPYILAAFLLSFSIASAAPITNVFTNIDPQANSTYYLGTTTPSTRAWKGIIADQFCLTADSCISTWPAGGPGGGSPFPFTARSYGVSTSTTVGFLNGLFSTASSTFNSSFFLPGLTQGFLYTGTNGQAQTIASSSVKLSWFNNDAGFITSLSGAASSTLLGDNNTFTGTDIFNNLKVGSANQILYTNASGVVTSAASSSLSLPNAALQNSSITVNGTSVSLGGSVTVSSTTLLSNNNTFSGNNTFSNAPVLGSLTGIIKGSSGTLSAASNGTDFTLITAKSCNAGDFVSSVTAAGVFTCTTPAGTTYTATWPIKVTGSVISTDFSTTTTWGMGNNGFVITGATGIPFIAASSSLSLPNTALQNSTISGTALGSNLGTLTINSPLTGSSYNGSAGVSIGCQSASGSQAGCLASADWTTFNNKLTTYNPFSTATNFGKTVVATTSPVGGTNLPIWFQSGLYASSTAVFDNATSTNATTTNLAVTSVKSALHLADANGLVTAYGGASACSANNFVTTLSATGGTTCGTAAISGVNLGGTLAALTAGTTLTSGGTYTGATARTFDIDLTHANNWTGLQTFTNASSTLQSVFSKLYVGGTATTTIDSTGNIVIPSGSGLTITGKSDGCATFATGVLNSTGVACGSGGGSFPFTPTTYNGQSVVSTSTAVWFTALPLSLIASSTFATNATTTNATTTNLFVGTNGGTSDSFFTLGPTSHEWSLIAASSSAANPYLFTIASSTDGSFPALTIDKNLLTTIAGGYVSQASSTVVGNFTLTGTAKIGTLGGLLLGTSGTVSAYGGASACSANNFVTALSSTGGTTCGTATISGINLGSNLNSLTHNTTLGGTSYNGSAAVSDWGLNLASSNAWTTNQGFGSSTPWAQLSIGTTTSSAPTTPLFAISSSTQNASAFIAGIFGGGKFGIGTTTPWAALSLDRNAAVASSTIVVNEYAYGTATSTTETVDCRTAEQSHIRIGGSATTITLTGGVPGQTCRVIVENPNLGTPGALTWGVSAGYLLLWAGGTTPTATATNNKQDIYSFLVTQGSSTIDFIGAQSANF